MPPPRYSNCPLPPYAHIPGETPHPVSDPRGHLHGQVHEPPPPLDPSAWQASDAYRYGVDLFNHGYYWEAHEAWESLWLAAGRSGPVAIWLKALIKLAAAMVKVRAGNAAGGCRHALRAQELLDELDEMFDPPHPVQSYCGVQLLGIHGVASEVSSIADGSPQRFDPNALLASSIELDYPS